jgi:phosphoenolpyruvate-protein kinase (PTS system EI component)
MSESCKHGIPAGITCGYCVLFESNDALKAELAQANLNTENWRQDANRYREALKNVREELAGCLERDKAFMSMTIEQVEAWNIARHNQSHGYCLDQIKDALNP